MPMDSLLSLAGPGSEDLLQRADERSEVVRGVDLGDAVERALTQAGEHRGEVLAAVDLALEQGLVDVGHALAGTGEIDHELLEEGRRVGGRLDARQGGELRGAVCRALHDALAQLRHAPGTPQPQTDAGG